MNKNAHATDGKLKARDEQFCREYIVDFNATKAAIRAGVPEKGAKVQACRFMTRPEIQDRVTELLAERATRANLDGDWVVTRLRGVAERCCAEETFDATGATRALDLLGKHLGIFEKDNAQRAPRLEAERLAAIDAEIQEMMNRGDTGNGAATRH